MKRSSVILLSLICFSIVFFSCGTKQGKYADYSKTLAGLYYKLVGFSDSKKKPANDQYLKLSMVYKTEADSVFLDTKSQNPTGIIILSAADIASKGLLGDGLLRMNEGDSMAFMLEAGNLFDKFFGTGLPLFLAPQSLVKVNVKLKDILDKKEYDAELEKYDEAITAWDVEEQRRIKNYIIENRLNALQQPDGMYYIKLADGKGEQVDSGKTVQINYTGYFLDGKKFDVTSVKKPFEFTIGDEFQVVWGLQQGIKLMKEGEKAKFIIPSYLAFGEEGSSTGIVPPFTTVVYEVELLKVK